MTTTTSTQLFVGLGPLDRELVDPFLAEHQTLVLDPTEEQLAVAEAAIVRAAFTVDAAMLDRMPALKVLARTGVGTDLVDVAEARRRGIPVVITPGSNTVSVAEGVFAHLLSLVKRLPTLSGLVRGGRWAERGQVTVGDLEGATLGIVGFGRIGRKVAQIAEAFDLNVRAYDPFADIPQAYHCAGVDEVLAASDFVTLHTPLTAENHHLINETRLAAMRPGTILVNCSRGALIDLDAAHAALASGQLAGLGLDVFDPEPPQHHPVFDHANTVLSPHLMGFTDRAMALTIRAAVEGAVAVLDGREPAAVAS
ncbi:oxidoreductase [Rhodococcus pseudokoreensis]|uniref:Oxidoreductase n=1 Tax=Rhodococcus pseudokoreensis TaxID=2811421 RepID=A0A974W3A8_9NOCA|nr:NAD(P)-dependent oxidoreductase [Rhodococcus pseudokoreensis]QSE89885.1 oxidoreductase [Rhodococcus pseudokoreensis]